MNSTDKKEWVELTDRDKMILRYLARFRAMMAATILAIVGLSDNYGRKRLAKLVRLGYIEQHRFYVNRPAIYVVTTKGMSAISSKAPYYSPKNDNAYHEAVVAEIACWLKLNHDFDLNTIMTEREMRKAEIKFGNKERTIPDLYAPDKSLCIEYEHTPKTTEKLRLKIINNASRCSRQIWVVDDGNSALVDRIKAISKELKYNPANSDMLIAHVSKEYISNKIKEGPSDVEKNACCEIFG